MIKNYRGILPILLFVSIVSPALAQDAQKFDLKCAVHSKNTGLDGGDPFEKESDSIEYFRINTTAQEWCSQSMDVGDAIPATCGDSHDDTIGYWKTLSSQEKINLSLMGGLIGSMDGDWLLIINSPPYEPPAGDTDYHDLDMKGAYDKRGVNLRTHQFAQHTLEIGNPADRTETVATGNCQVLPFSGKF